MFFLKNHTENKAGRLVPDLFLFSKKALYEVKANAWFQYILIVLNFAYNKKMVKHTTNWSGNSFSTTFCV